MKTERTITAGALRLRITVETADGDTHSVFSEQPALLAGIANRASIAANVGLRNVNNLHLPSPAESSNV